MKEKFSLCVYTVYWHLAQPFRMTKQIKKNTHTDIPQTPMRFIWHVARPHTRWLYGTVIAVTIAEIASSSVPFIFRSIIDSAQGALNAAGSIEKVWFWAILYPVTTGIIFIAWRTSGFVGLGLTTRANATAYNTLFQYLSHHSHSYFSNRFAGTLSSKVTHASEGTQALVEAFLWNYYPTILSLVFTFVYIAFSSVYAALVFLVLLIVLIPLNVYIANYRRPHVVEYSKQATKARGYAVDAITNMAAIRQFSRTTEEQTRFAMHIDEMRILNAKQSRISEWGLSINNIIIVLFEAIILLIGVQMWTVGSITVGELVMIVTLMISVQGSLVFIGNGMNGFIRRYSEIQEGLTDILVPYDISDRLNAKILSLKDGKIEWNTVSFDYGDSSVFNEFNLVIKPGERVGLVGSSGAGKSTFVSLLLRQHELTGGAILIDDQNIAEVTQDSLRENIAVVPQEPMLFHRSIRENIAYGKPDATEEEIIAVAQKAEAHDFIMTLKDGYSTLVGERGVKLSGGQKQRVAIARAMLKNAPILILDEATSALDSESEVAIQKALHELMVGKTVVAIAHRLSTLREMDRIIVLDAGKIVEDGTHATLTKKRNGIYARLWKHQAGGFLTE